MSDPSEQPPEGREEGRPNLPRPKTPSVSPPAFAAVLLVLAIGGVLAWLALSADKSSSPPVEQANATLTIQLGGEESKAADAAEPEAPEETQAKGKSEEANTAALPEPAVEAGADEAAVPEVADQDKV